MLLFPQLYIFLLAAILHASASYKGPVLTVTVTATATETTSVTYRAGLVLINSMTISGTDAYAKDFSVDNVAEISFANSIMNVFAVPSTATCAYMSRVIY